MPRSPAHSRAELSAKIFPASPAMALALARVLVVAMAFGVAAVPAFVAGVDFAGWGLAAMALALAMRVPMAGLCASMGAGAYVLFTALALVWPGLLGSSGLLAGDVWMQGCAWLTLVASVLALALLDVTTFNRAFRQEGRPVAELQANITPALPPSSPAL